MKLRFTLAVLAVSASLQAQTPSAQPSLVTTSLTVREAYDDNVFLQSATALSDHESLVSSVALNISATSQTGPEFKATLSYAPEMVVFHSEKTENHLDHRVALNLAGKCGAWVWEAQNSVLAINGKNEGPSFLPGGDIPALGGIPLRDRRDADIYRNGVKATYTQGAWFVRPQFNAYVHDFQTVEHARVGAYAGYENFVSRSEVSGALDVGRKINSGLWLVGSYRYGHQQQKKLLGVKSPYSNNYQRLLVGVEGTVTPWLKASVLVGPDLRDFDANPNPAFNRKEELYFLDSTLTFTPTKTDTVTLTARRYEQPAFSSHSVYEDIVYDLAWRHQCASQVTAALGVKVYEGDWQGPVNREDWVYTYSASVSRAFTKQLSGDIAYSYDTVVSDIPNTSAREFRRQILSVGLKYTF
ncbi:MAG: hypothetical protein HZA31_02445 [Opitutae bacterium]|nr:hypothetical protein [Opitutae bacterium]